MTLFLMVGILLIILVGINRNKLVNSISLNNRLVKKLSNYE